MPKQGATSVGGGKLNQVQRQFLDLVYDTGRSQTKHKKMDDMHTFLQHLAADEVAAVINVQEVAQDQRPYSVYSLGKWEGYTPLHIAAHYGYDEVCKMLLVWKADPNIAESEHKRTPLHTVVGRNLPAAEALVHLLLQDGADPNIPDRLGNTPLHIAIWELREFHRVAKPDKSGPKLCYNEEALVESLLQGGANPLAVNVAGETPFDLAQAPGGGIQIPSLKVQHERLLRQQLRVALFAQPQFGPAVDVAWQELGDADCDLLEWCTAESSVTSINCGHNALTAAVFSETLLRQLRHLTSLNLEHNNLGDAGLSALLPALGEVVSLNVADNGITKDGMEMAAEFAAQSRCLKELVLSGNPNPGDSLHSLGRAIARNRNLRWLALARCGIRESDALLCTCQVLAPRDLPFGLDFRGNGIKTPGKLLRHLEQQQLPALVCLDGQVAHTTLIDFRDSPLLRSVRNLVLEGGGVKGIAYLGAIRKLEEHGIHFSDFDGVAGTSVGAITATLLAVGFRGEDLAVLQKMLPLESFLDFDPQLHGNKRFALDEVKKDVMEVIEGFSNGGLFSATALLSSKEAIGRIRQVVDYLEAHEGLCQGDKLREWMEDRIREKVGVEHLTFYDLHHLQLANGQRPQDLLLVGLNLSTGQTEVFSYRTTPFVVISDAVRISLSIPFIFKPHKKFVKYPPRRDLSPRGKGQGEVSGEQDAPCGPDSPHGSSKVSESSSPLLPPAPAVTRDAGHDLPPPAHRCPSPSPSPTKQGPPGPAALGSLGMTLLDSFYTSSEEAPYHSLSAVMATDVAELQRAKTDVPLTLQAEPRFRTGSVQVGISSHASAEREERCYGKRQSMPMAHSLPRRVAIVDRLRDHHRHADLSLHRYVDGAVTCNYPLCIVSRHSALGMRLVSGDQAAVVHRYHPAQARATKGLRNFSAALFQGFLLGSMFAEEQREDNVRTIYINAGDVHGVDFNLGDEQQDALLRAGQDAVVDYLSQTMRRHLFQLTSFRGSSCVPVSLRPRPPQPPPPF